MGYKIGTGISSLVTLASLGIPDPKGVYRQGTEQRPLVSGGVRNVGLVRLVWHWDFFRTEWHDALRTYLPNTSDHVFIESMTTENEDEFKVFEVLSAWPLNLELDSYRRMNFDINFAVLGTGTVTVFMQPITIGLAIRSFELQPYTSISFDLLSIASSTPSLTVPDPGDAVPLDLLTLASSILDADIQGGSRTVSLSALSLASSAPQLSVT